ncbi:MAG TPA: porin [Anaeromyxobacteraceae bacterium]|nr:porin [Anaeromyxobacteraceae bacterium]
MNPRSLAVLAAMVIAPAAAHAQEAAAPATPTPTPAAAPARDLAADVDSVGGKVDAVTEKVAELETSVAGLKKLKFSGYVQGRWAWLEGARYEPKCAAATCTADELKAYAPPDKDNFYIRRGRFKTTYTGDVAQAVLQMDVVPSGVSIKEGYVSVNLPAGLAVDTGLQLFPFGYEVGQRSSADLDLLERSQVTGKLLKGEYDLGVALRGASGPVNFKVGLFNGNGIDGGKGKDNDQLKDVIGRVGFDLGTVTGGLSGWYGKTIDYTSTANTEYDRVRAAADLQVYLDLLPIGGTALKGEYIWGKTAIGTGAAGAGDKLGKTMSGYYLLASQNVGKTYQVDVRWDSFIADHGIDHDAASNAAKVFQTNELSAAVHAFVGEAYKLSLAYYHPMNGTKGPTAPSDPKSDSVVAQAQVKF